MRYFEYHAQCHGAKKKESRRLIDVLVLLTNPPIRVPFSEIRHPHTVVGPSCGTDSTKQCTQGTGTGEGNKPTFTASCSYLSKYSILLNNKKSYYFSSCSNRTTNSRCSPSCCWCLTAHQHEIVKQNGALSIYLVRKKLWSLSLHENRHLVPVFIKLISTALITFKKKTFLG